MGGPQIDALGIAVSDMALAVAFYSRLGLEFPPGSAEQPHAEAMLGSSVRLMLDTEAMLRQIDPEWSATLRDDSVLRCGCPIRRHSMPCTTNSPPTVSV